METQIPAVESRQDRLASSALLARNATLNILAEGWLALVLFACIPLLVRFLGQESFGLFSLAFVVVGYLAFLDVGVSTATTKFTSEYLAKQDRGQIGILLRTALAANSVMGTLAGTIAVALAPFLIQHAFKIPVALQRQAFSVFVVMGFALPLLLVHGVLRAALSSYQRFDWINLVNASAMSAQWVIMALLAWKGFGVVAVVWVAVGARLAIVSAYLFLLSRLVPDVFSRFSFCWDTLWRLLHFGVWVSVSQVMSPILVYLDRVMIAALVSLSAVTIYTVPTEVFNRLGFLPASLMATLFPAFSLHGAAESEAALTRLYNMTTRYLFLVLLPLFSVLLICSRDLLSVWMGLRFASDATLVFQILALGALVNFVARLPYGAVQALGRPDLTGKFHLFELPVYIALCLILIPMRGIEGAALACTLRVWLDAALMFWAARKHCRLKLKWWGAFGRMLVVEAVLVAALLASHYRLREVWVRLLTSVFLLALAYVGIWFFALNHEDKPAIARTIRFAGEGVG